MNARIAAVLALLALACSKAAPPPVALKIRRPPAPPPINLPNLLAIHRGGSVLSRTGEAELTHSAVRAIDDDGQTTWLTPPGDAKQSAVFALAARARIENAGIVTSSVENAAARAVTLDFSDDGQRFANPHTLQLKPMFGEQREAIPPVVARFVRVTINSGRGAYVQINDVSLHGSFVAPPEVASLTGSWLVNGQHATFEAQRNSVSGYVGGEDDTTLEGGSDGSFYRFAWTRGPQYGLAAIGITPDGRHLSGCVWHEEAVQAPQFFANDWLGERAAAVATRSRESVLETYLRRFGYFPLFGLRFAPDGTLDDAESTPLLDRLAKLLAMNSQLRVRFVAHELTHASAQENLAVSQKEIATLHSALAAHKFDLSRIEFVAAGQEQPHREPSSDITRAMYSSVDLEIRR